MPANSTEYMRGYYAKHKDKFKKSRKKCHEKNREKSLADMRAYYRANKERFGEAAKVYRASTQRERAEYQKAYREKNKEKLKETRQKYFDDNKEKIRAARRKIRVRYRTAAARAADRGMTFSLSFEEYSALITPGVCHYCDGALNTTGSGLDRKSNERHYTTENAVPCCRRCNVTFSDFYSYAEKLVLAKAIKAIDAARHKTADGTVVTGSVTLT